MVDLNKQLWYVRRGKRVQGPFTARLVSRYLLIGRIRMSDELSIDGFEWQKAEALPELFPDVLHGDLDDPHVKQRILAAIRWEDERSGHDRRDRGGGKGRADKDRRGRERRQVELPTQIDHRESRTERLEQRTAPDQAPRYRLASIVVLVAGTLLAGAFFVLPRPPEEVPPECNAEPRDFIVWNHCQLQGAFYPAADLRGAKMRSINLTGANLAGAHLKEADVSYGNLSLVNLRSADLRNTVLTGANFRNANLTSANLTGADLSYADLGGADLRGAVLRGAILDKAIWTDSTLCQPGSVGECLR
jgi:hypothetical protein